MKTATEAVLSRRTKNFMTASDNLSEARSKYAKECPRYSKKPEYLVMAELAYQGAWRALDNARDALEAESR